MASSQNLYALLVGINDYKTVSTLRGCVNDVNAVENYLTQRTTFDLTLDGQATGKIRKLTDSAATRTDLIDGFRTHLSKAKKGDTVLFYYSGHGTQEQAAPIWEETDERLECLVCYDGNTTASPQFLLADKELRFLLHELHQKTDAHIVAIFDCCHSGDNTRNAALVEATHDNVLQRRTTNNGKTFPMRQWNEFVFGNAISEASAKGKKSVDFLPQGAHIQLAACESDQTAVEVNGAGVFTKTLLKTLTDAGGNLSYNTLRGRVRQYMRAGYEQTPRIYAPVAPEQSLKGGVFNQAIDPQQTIAEAVLNARDRWQLNVGAIHGVGEDTKVTLIDPTDVTKTFPVSVRKGGVFVDFTQLVDFREITDRNDPNYLNQNKVYKALVSGLMSEELVLELQNHDGNPALLESFTGSLTKVTNGNVVFGGEQTANETPATGATQPADYTLHVRAGEAYLTRPNDPFRPLFRPQPFLLADEQKALGATLQHVSRWHFIRNLQKATPLQDFPADALRIELTRVFADGTTESIDTSKGMGNIIFEPTGNAWRGTIQIRITNTTQQDLYVCVAYLMTEFGCFLDFLPNRVQKLEAGKSLLLGPNGKDRVNLKLGRVVQEYNWPETRETLQFIVSTDEFDGEALTLETLPEPLTTADIGNAKGLDIESDDTRGLDTGVSFSGWMTQRLDLVFTNPVYNQVPLETIKTLIEWDETAYFAEGLYYDIQLDETGQPTIWKLKPKLNKGLKVPEGEKNIIDDIKLFLGNKIESAQRRKRYRNLKRDPSRLRIVAEGDSWFQYPILVQDTLDHLYKLYAIRSFAEAGDTLENYLKKRVYLDAIEEEGADFFLVSGGGNDILGKQFEGFLRDTPKPGDTTFGKYFNDDFTAKLTQLEEFYEDMFGELLFRYPKLHILVHSYDYVIPLDTTLPENKKKSSWLGQYLIKKNIKPQAEREQCINFIMDKFNDRLKQVVAKFGDRVSYIDVRGAVNRNSWFDEIHPTDAGFQLVANKFMEEIERVRGKKPVS